jgi:hypothetical protein
LAAMEQRLVSSELQVSGATEICCRLFQLWKLSSKNHDPRPLAKRPGGDSSMRWAC